MLGMLEDAVSLEEAGARDMNLKIMPSLPLHPVCRELRSLLFYITPTLGHSGQAHGQVNKGFKPSETRSQINQTSCLSRGFREVFCHNGEKSN